MKTAILRPQGRGDVEANGTSPSFWGLSQVPENCPQQTQHGTQQCFKEPQLISFSEWKE